MEFSRKKLRNKKKKNRYDVIMLIAFNELLNNRWIKQIPLKIDANFDEDDSFRHKVGNRTYFQIRVYRKNRRDDFFRSNIYRIRKYRLTN